MAQASRGSVEVVKFMKEIVSERLGKDAFVKMIKGTCFDPSRRYRAWVIEIKKVELVEFLMSLESFDHTIVDVHGYTPLHHAAAFGRLRAVKSFLEASRFSKDERLRMEYLKMKTEDGSTAIDLARRGEKWEIFDVSLKTLSLFHVLRMVTNE